MKNTWLAIILGVAAVASAQVVTVPQGTPVQLRLTDTLSSDSSKDGDAVRFAVAADVMVNGSAVIRREAKASGEVTDAQAKRRMGRGGHVEFVVRYVTAADASRVDVSGDQRAKGGNGAGKMAVSAALFMPAPVFLLAKGHDTSIPAGTVITVYTTAAAAVDMAKVAAPVAAPVRVAQPTEERHVVEYVFTQAGTGTDAAGMGSAGDTDTLANAARKARAARAAREAAEAGKQ